MLILDDEVNIKYIQRLNIWLSRFTLYLVLDTIIYEVLQSLDMILIWIVRIASGNKAKTSLDTTLTIQINNTISSH